MLKQNKPKLQTKDKTLVLGASLKPNRYAYVALKRLQKNHIPVVGVGAKAGELEGIKIYNFQKKFTDIDTVTLYLNSKNQEDYYDYILQLQPRRVIFNPGTQNPKLESLLTKNQIEVTHACTLVLLSTQQY